MGVINTVEGRGAPPPEGKAARAKLVGWWTVRRKGGMEEAVDRKASNKLVFFLFVDEQIVAFRIQ